MPKVITNAQTSKAGEAADVTNKLQIALENLFSMYGTPEDIDKSLWELTVAAIASNQFDHVGIERANCLYLYREISNIIKLLKPTE